MSLLAQQTVNDWPIKARALIWLLFKHIYIITRVIPALWLLFAYDLLEDRRTIDVINAKAFPLHFKMAESFENLNNILRDWVKDKVQKCPEHWIGVRSSKKKEKNRFISRK